MVELKIEDFKPEFAGKMNFYLSAVDELVRHESDGPTIGIILCKGKNAVVVEYALRDTARPMGVAEYRMSPLLPARLESELPTVQEFAREFPLMSVVQLRVEVERELRTLMESRGAETRWAGIGQMLRELQTSGALPPSTGDFEAALRVMNDAAHGIDVDPIAAEEAVRIGSRFLEELKHGRDS